MTLIKTLLVREQVIVVILTMIKMNVGLGLYSCDIYINETKDHFITGWSIFPVAIS